MGDKLEQFSFDDLKCNFCEKYLTICPPSCTSKDGKEYKCGRCKDVPTGLEIRNYPLEKLVGHVPLPCSYQGCEEKLASGEVEKHEEECPQRIFPCPVAFDCQDKMKLDDFKSHFQEKHENQWFENDVSYDLNVNTNNCVCCLFSSGVLFIIFIVRKDPITYIGVYTSADFSAFTYKLRVSDVDKEVPFVSYDGDVLKYKEHDHCYNCVEKRCAVIFHTGKNKNLLDEMLRYNFRDVIKVLTSNNKPINNLRYKISISRIDQNASKNMEPITDDQLNLRKTLLCPNCNRCLTAKKYCCCLGHVICETCRNKLYQCSVCQPPLPLVKNYAFENLIERIQLPCINSGKGCGFTGKVHEVRKHESSCPHKD